MTSQALEVHPSPQRRSWWKWLAALFVLTLIGVAVGVFFWLQSDEELGVTAYVEVSFRSAISSLDPLVEPIPRWEAERRQLSLLTIAKSPLILQAAVSREDVAQLEMLQAPERSDDPVLWLAENMQVSYPAEGDILEFALPKGPDPDELETLLQAIVDSFLNEVKFESRSRRADNRKELLEVLEDHQKELENSMIRYAEMTRHLDADELLEDPRIVMLKDEIDVQRQIVRQLLETSARDGIRQHLFRDHVRLVQTAFATSD